MKTTDKGDKIPFLLVFLCWILPLMGLVWDTGWWYRYLIWLVLGTAVLGWWVDRHPIEEPTEQ